MAPNRMNHLNRNIPPEPHPPMYLWHKFWSRKTWNVVSEYIKNYSNDGDIVFDPFSGSGITPMEALRNKRKAISCDLNPIATKILEYTVKNISENKIRYAYDRIREKVKSKIESLYLTRCRGCGKELVINCAIWIGKECKEIRYKTCPSCSDRRAGDCDLNSYDKKLLKKIENEAIKEWYPKNKLYYPNGQPFKEKQQYDSVDELFTKRNLIALALLLCAIEEESTKDIREILKLAFSSMAHLCSKMSPISEAGHFTPFSSAWTQHSYWYPSGPHMEQNVWLKFDSAINGAQGLIKAKVESNSIFKDVKIAKSLKRFDDGDYDLLIHTGSCLDFMAKMGKENIDYIFTDPPYDASIQFGELCYMWNCWLKLDDRYLENMLANEIIRNERQNKDFEVYHSLIRSSFKKMFEVLKQGKYLSLTFHNPTFKVRNSTIRAGVYAGFDFEKIFHQELARPSTKSLMQPFGSAQGDFYLRFYKPTLSETALPPNPFLNCQHQN